MLRAGGSKVYIRFNYVLMTNHNKMSSQVLINYEVSPLVKLKLFLCLTKYHAMNTYPVLSYSPRQEDVLGE